MGLASQRALSVYLKGCWAIAAQNTKEASAFTSLNALDAHLSKIPLVSRHLFSSKLLAVMQVLKVVTSATQNLARMACLGESSSSLGKLIQIINNRKGTYKMTLSSTRVDFFLVPPNMWTIFSIGMITS